MFDILPQQGSSLCFCTLVALEHMPLMHVSSIKVKSGNKVNLKNKMPHGGKFQT